MLEELNKQKLELFQETQQLTQEISLKQAQQTFSQLIQENQLLLSELTTHSNKIDLDVKEISDITQGTFDKLNQLRNSKLNIETLLNTDILPRISNAVQQKDMKGLLKEFKIYDEIKEYILFDFCESEQVRMNAFSSQMQALIREQFEKAISQNDSRLLSECSSLSSILHMDDNILDKIKAMYSESLKLDLVPIQEELQKRPTNYKDLDDHKMFFFQTFIKILSKVNSSFEGYKQSVLTLHAIFDLLLILKHQMDQVVDPLMKMVFARLTVFYGLSHNSTIDPTTLFAKKDAEQQRMINVRIDTFCEEVANISNQSEIFKRHIITNLLLSSPGIDQSQTIEQTSQQLHQQQYQQQYQMNAHVMEQIKMNDNILHLLGQYLSLEQCSLQQQLHNILLTHSSYTNLQDLERNIAYFQQFMHEKETLNQNTQLYEYLDEVFYLASAAATRALFTLNDTVACAMLNFLSLTLFSEDLHFAQRHLLLDVHLKKGAFQATLQTAFSPNITFLIILLNNTEQVNVYLSSLKTSLLEEYAKLNNNNQSQTMTSLLINHENNMVCSAIEEMERTNIARFNHLLHDSMSVLTSLLLSSKSSAIYSIMETFDQTDYTSFLSKTDSKDTQSQLQLLQLQQQEDQFLHKFKQLFNSALVQWQLQFTIHNFELFMTLLSQDLANIIQSKTMQKRFSQVGAFQLDKQIRTIVAFLQEKTGLVQIKRSFARMQIMCEVLMADTNSDLDQFCILFCQDLSEEEIHNIARLRIDLFQS